LAIPYLEKAITNISANYKEGNYKEDRAPQEALFYLAKAYRLNGQFDKAIQTYKQYQGYIGVSDVYLIDFVALQIKTCETAIQMTANPIYFVENELSIGQSGENYYPAVSGDGKSIAFTAYQEVKDPIEGDGFFDIIYYSTQDGNEWKKPKDISQDLASDGYFSSTALSYNGDMLILYRDDYGNGNIYFSTKDKNHWLPFTKFPKQISSKYNETHGSLSKDGSTLFFVSDRPGSIGLRDIYKCTIDNEGRWGAPENLGSTINTEFEEETPFLAEDGKTLYFASEAHSSIGGFDIFKSVLDDNGTWSEPQNLGYPINSSADDVFYVPLGDGSTAYMARFPAGGKDKKIFKIEYPKIERTVEVVAETIATPVDTIDTANPQNANVAAIPVTEIAVVEPDVKKIVVPSEYDLIGKISLQDNRDMDASFYVHVTKPDGQVVAALSPDITTGEFKAKIKHGSYTIKAFGDGYEPSEKTVVINEDQQSPEVRTSLKMIPKEVSSGEYVAVKSILFDYNSNILNRESQIEIEKLAQLMEKNSSLYVEVSGNTDSHGTDEYNIGLSAKRARAVVEYIHDKGVDASRFVTKALGKENFIAINENPDGSDNPEGRRLNRRVDIKIIKSNNDNITIQSIDVPDELKYQEQVTYTIFLMQTEKPLEPSFFSKSGQTISNVWMYQVGEGYIYTLGKFSKQADALTLMNVVVDAGFPDAKVITNQDYNELVQKSSNFYKSKLSENDSKVYSIQLYALKNANQVPNFKGLKDVNKIPCADGYTRYLWGEYIGKISAKQALNGVIELGFYDAFVVETDKYKN
jgi:outer membrane protein OmpA-like peptidoglycan-associated protein/Tol biopolymer transport system component